MKRVLVFILAVVMLVPACAPTPVSNVAVESKSLTVYAAASLTDAFTEISENFKAANPGVKVRLNFAGSQTLRTQIEQGARVDLFASANAKEMDALVTGKFVGADTAQIFLTNQLVVILPEDNAAEITQLADLSNSGLKLILAAKEVPVGNYSLQVLDELDQAFGGGYKDKVLANVASYENDVKQVVAKVQLGEADAGIVYSSDSVAARDLQKIDIPVEYNTVAKYPIAALTQTREPELAQAFITYVLSSEGQSILQEWGFLPVQ